MSQGGGEALSNPQFNTLNKDLEPCTSSGQVSLNSKNAQAIVTKQASPRNTNLIQANLKVVKRNNQKRPINTVCVPQRSLMELIPD